VYSIENENVVAQALINAYIGTSMLTVMARQQNNARSQEACVLANQKCQDALQHFELSEELDMPATKILLNAISRLARDLWNIQMTPTGEQINLRIVNDIAIAERHIEAPETANAIGQPANLEHFIADLRGKLKTTENLSPYLAMLAENDEALTIEGLRAATQVSDSIRNIEAKNLQPTIVEKPVSPEGTAQPARSCKTSKLPNKEPTLSTIQELETWISAIAEAGGLPDATVFAETLNECEKAPRKANDHTEHLVERWASQFKNLPEDWVEDASKRLVRSACSTELDTLNDTAVDRVRKTLSAFNVQVPAVEVLVEDKPASPEVGSETNVDALDAKSIDELMDRKERLMEELDQIEEAIENRSNAFSWSSN